MPSSKSISNNAYSVIEGEWKNFRFRRIQPKDYDAVLDHIAKNFVRDEPTCNLLGFSDTLAADFNRVVEMMLKDNMSFLAEDIATGEIAGVRVTFHHTPETTFDNIRIDSHQAKILFKLVEEIEEMANAPAKLGVDNWAEFFVASTSPKYRNQGLAGEFYRRSIEFLKESGFKHALVIVSSPFTRAATERQGFVELAKLDYHDLLGFDAKRVFSDDQLTHQPHACVRIKHL